jgi:hypothetical protein
MRAKVSTPVGKKGEREVLGGAGSRENGHQLILVVACDDRDMGRGYVLIDQFANISADGGEATPEGAAGGGAAEARRENFGRHRLKHLY